jgi:hypothetical protein
MSIAWGSLFIGIIVGWLLSGVLGKAVSKATG